MRNTIKDDKIADKLDAATIIVVAAIAPPLESKGWNMNFKKSKKEKRESGREEIYNNSRACSQISKLEDRRQNFKRTRP